MPAPAGPPAPLGAPDAPPPMYRALLAPPPPLTGRPPRPPAPRAAGDAPARRCRAFFALPTTITDGTGRPVNALLGTTNLILQVVEQHRPRAVVMCWGPESADYRTAAYPAYHADRPPMPDELLD